MSVAITLSLRTEPDGVSGRLRLAPSPPSAHPSWLAPVASLALLSPLGLAILAEAARRVGLAEPQHLLSIVEAGGVGAAILRASVWAGPALAVVLSALAMLRVSRSRSEDRAAEVTIRLGLVPAMVFALALVLAAAFYGHLVADAVACSNGLRSAC